VRFTLLKIEGLLAEFCAGSWLYYARFLPRSRFFAAQNNLQTLGILIAQPSDDGRSENSNSLKHGFHLFRTPEKV